MTDEPRSGADLIDEAEREALQAYADRDAALERLGAVLAERDQLARLHEVATERVVGYAAVIEQANAIGDLPMDDMTDEQAVTAILERLASADTDAALREVRATALEDAVSEFEHRVGLEEFDTQTSRDGCHWTFIAEAWNLQGPFMDWLRNRASEIREGAKSGG